MSEMFDVSFNKSSSNAFICGIGGENALDGEPKLSFDVVFVFFVQKKYAFQRILCVTLSTFSIKRRLYWSLDGIPMLFSE